jgi:predicted nucleic acid-binding protein
MQNELIKINNSLTLNEKPSNEIAYKLTDKFELKIYDAIQTMGICQCSRIEVKEVLKSCLQLSGTQTPDLKDFEFIVDFVIDNYGNFRLKELKTAFEMMAADRLAVDKHIIFNPRLIGEVMSAYKKIAIEVRKKIEPKSESNVPKFIIDEEQAIKDEIEWWKKSKRKDWQLINHQIFDYLWKRKLIKMSKEEADRIKEKVRIAILGKATKPSEVVITDDQMKILAKKYSLMIYFNNL